MIEKYREDWSNCFFTALVKKIKHPFKIKIHKRGSWINELIKLKFPHFYWFDEIKRDYYHFQSAKGGLLFFRQLWFKGSVREFKYHNK